ncbi:MAG: hypothetical protein GXO55_02635 [Chloroflexi bacterium]|nr:hypothetical protein [Chloroflexota bacterium]
MVITTRTLAWLGLGIFLLGVIILGVFLQYVPPTPPTVALLFFFTFITVAALGVALHALFLLARGKSAPEGTLFHGAWLGLMALVLLFTLYLGLLDWIVFGTIFMLGILGEVVYLYYRRMPELTQAASKTPRRVLPSKTKTRVKGVRKRSAKGEGKSTKSRGKSKKK